MVVVEEEFIEKYYRLLTIKEDGSTIVKRDVYCDVDLSTLDDKSLLFEEAMSDSKIAVYMAGFKDGLKGVILCVDGDCKLIDLLGVNVSKDDLRDHACR
ncbi:MAG: hypothetical protein GSR82_04410 [Desulfurococcales archaeon]|nr:hypothetical protein [Desulfurococcales archaeon]MEB3799223.1 hypothetical protein [Desulfurococcales archaeon]